MIQSGSLFETLGTFAEVPSSSPKLYQGAPDAEGVGFLSSLESLFQSSESSLSQNENVSNVSEVTSSKEKSSTSQGEALPMDLAWMVQNLSMATGQAPAPVVSAQNTEEVSSLQSTSGVTNKKGDILSFLKDGKGLSLEQTRTALLKSPFVSEALAKGVSTFMSEKISVAEICRLLELKIEDLQEAGVILSGTETLTPAQLLKQIGVDPYIASAKLMNFQYALEKNAVNEFLESPPTQAAGSQKLTEEVERSAGAPVKQKSFVPPTQAEGENSKLSSKKSKAPLSVEPGAMAEAASSSAKKPEKIDAPLLNVSPTVAATQARTTQASARPTASAARSPEMEKALSEMVIREGGDWKSWSNAHSPKQSAAIASQEIVTNLEMNSPSEILPALVIQNTLPEVTGLSSSSDSLEKDFKDDVPDLQLHGQDSISLSPSASKSHPALETSKDQVLRRQDVTPQQQIKNEIEALYHKNGDAVLVKLEGMESEPIGISLKMVGDQAQIEILTSSSRMGEWMEKALVEMKSTDPLHLPMRMGETKVSVVDPSSLQHYLGENFSRSSYQGDSHDARWDREQAPWAKQGALQGAARMTSIMASRKPLYSQTNYSTMQLLA